MLLEITSLWVSLQRCCSILCSALYHFSDGFDHSRSAMASARGNILDSTEYVSAWKVQLI